MFKWIARLDRLIKAVSVVVKILVAILNALDPPHNHDNPVDQEIKNRNSSK